MTETSFTHHDQNFLPQVMLTCLRVARRRRTSSLANSWQTAGVRTAAGGRTGGHPTKRIHAAAARDSSSPEAGYLEWLNGAGLRFKAASPQNWIGGDVVKFIPSRFFTSR